MDHPPERRSRRRGDRVTAGPMVGEARKEPAPEEIANRAIARRSLVAARPIAAGEPFSIDNLTAKRPADGLSPMAIWSLLDRTSPRAYAEDEAVEA